MDFTSITATRSFGSRNLRDEDGTALFPLYFTSENVEDNRSRCFGVEAAYSFQSSR